MNTGLDTIKEVKAVTNQNEKSWYDFLTPRNISDAIKNPTAMGRAWYFDKAAIPRKIPKKKPYLIERELWFLFETKNAFKIKYKAPEIANKRDPSGNKIMPSKLNTGANWKRINVHSAFSLVKFLCFISAIILELIKIKTAVNKCKNGRKKRAPKDPWNKSPPKYEIQETKGGASM